jgi:DNA repair exonuclease SbcCD ATPase subunit
MVADYKKKLESYNKEVSSWNKKGGAPEDAYNELKKEKKELDALYDKIEAERKAINNLAGKSNDLVNKEKNVVNTYNSNVETYQNKYGQASEFDKGIYDGQKIDIFQFKEMSDLRLTLVHEMGHALGIDHLENPKSIMYYLMNEQDMNNPTLSSEDLVAIKGICKIK